MTLGARIKAVRGSLSQGDFAEALGLSKSAIGGYERDAQAPGSAVIASICARFGIDPGWLLFGSGSGRTGEGRQPFEKADDADMIRVPLVEARLSHGVFAPAGEAEQRFGFRRSFLRGRGQPERMVLMRVDGDSMEPEIRHGDLALLDQGQTAPRPGTLFAVSFEDMVYIKMVDAIPGKIVLQSFNAAYPPIEVDARSGLTDGVRIVGKAVWLCRELR